MQNHSSLGSVERYFDNAATTPLDPRVLDEMLPFLREDFGNSHSLHSLGLKANAAVELARQRVADAIGAEDPSQIIFTSGATEANNQVLRAFPSGLISPFEHSAVREPATRLGFETLENSGPDLVLPDHYVELISVMRVNNEIGTIWSPSEFRANCDLLHTDLTQAVGKIDTTLEDIDFASLSAHKFYGPKGVGALYAKDLRPESLLQGGGQESDARAGTLNVPGIVGMGIAAKISRSEQEANLAHVSKLRSVLLEELSGCADWKINGGKTVSPYIVSISFADVFGETLLIEVDRRGYAISSGAACSSRSTEPSHVLVALGISESWQKGTIRISFSKFNTVESTVGLAKYLQDAVQTLRKMS